MAALLPGRDHARGRGDLSIQVSPGSRACRPDPRQPCPEGQRVPLLQGEVRARKGGPASPSPGASGGPRGPPPPEPCAVGTAVGSQPSPTLGEFCLLLQQKGFHLPWNQHGLKTKPPWSAPSHEDACPSGLAPRGAPFGGEPGQGALPTSCVNCVSRRTPLVGFRADDHQSRQSQGRRFGARLLIPNDSREQSQLLWKVPRLPPQVGGLQGNMGGQTPSSRQPPGAHLRLESKAPGELFPGRSSSHGAISAREQVLTI